jgi:NADH-quinone oxidoreductase subunit K
MGIPESALVLSAVLFLTGSAGVLLRRNIIIVFMSIELMMNAANISLVAFAFRLGAMEGRVAVLFVLTVAAAEAAIGLGIIIALYRKTGSVDVDRLSRLRW